MLLCGCLPTFKLEFVLNVESAFTHLCVVALNTDPHPSVLGCICTFISSLCFSPSSPRLSPSPTPSCGPRHLTLPPLACHPLSTSIGVPSFYLLGMTPSLYLHRCTTLPLPPPRHHPPSTSADATLALYLHLRTHHPPTPLLRQRAAPPSSLHDR